MSYDYLFNTWSIQQSFLIDRVGMLFIPNGVCNLNTYGNQY